jgi:Tfp pilus assembly pilus retraction ATPase PilT
MNRWQEVIRLLVDDKELLELVIVPNAPPVSPRAEGRRVVGDQVFSDTDVAETLMGAAAHASRQGELGRAGVLCIGVRNVGRIRISYFTQRGSRFLRIVRVPFDVPTIDAVCAEPLQARELVQAIAARRYKAILIYGPTHMINSKLIYALLNELNKSHRAVIFIAEQMLSFLLAHDNSIVIQVEVPTDAPSLEDATAHAFLLEPDVVHLGDVKVTDHLPSLPQLFNADMCTIVTTVSEDASLLLDRLPEWLHRSLVEHGAGMLLSVRPADDGRLQLEAHPWPLLKRTGLSRRRPIASNHTLERA